ncbi:MAG: outer membrane lipoprotein-sorting protein [Spirochaetaceae bacterium]|jgi:hypothetical protein|nr:outer membrane lipoprotein-sorting protein [Spirochaetaceae bacterium]
MMKIIKISIFMCLISMPLFSITLDEILQGFEDVTRIPNLQATIKVQMISQSGDVREIEAEAYQKMDGESQNNRLFVFNYPPTVRDTGLLIHSFYDGRDSNMWLYLPAIGRIKRIALESSGGGYFMGSDFTYQDLISKNAEGFIYERLDDQVVDGYDCYVLEVHGVSREKQQEVGYSRYISYHRKDSFLLQRQEYYDLSGELLKIYTVQESTDFDNFVYPSKISMENVQSNHRSIIEATNLTIGDIPDRYFSQRYLQNH